MDAGAAPTGTDAQRQAGLGSIRAPAVPPLLTVREAAERLRVCTALVYRACSRGELAHVRVGSAIRIPSTALDAYLASGGRA